MLDLETAPCPETLAMAGAPNGRAGAALHRIVAATVLRYDAAAGGAGATMRLDRLDCADGGERGLLARLDALLPAAGPEARLVTFNGAAWDLPVMRVRAAATWSLSLRTLPGWWANPPGRHVDVMLQVANGGDARWPSLVEVAAAFGIDLAAARGRRGGEGDVAAMRRCTSDVMATFLAHLFLEAADAGDPSPLAAGWTALADLILRDPKLACHRYFALHEALAPLRRLAGTAAGRRPASA